MDNSALVQRNKIQSHAIEMFCDSKNLSPPIMNNIFTQKDNGWDKLRQISQFSRPLVKSVHYGSESVSFLGMKIWDMLQDGCRDIDNWILLRIKLRNWNLKVVLAGSVKFTLTI